MKHLNILIPSVCIVFLLTACHTSTEVIVFTEPGTEILKPNYNQLCVADNNGKAVFEIDDDIHYSFLFSHKPGTLEYIPFALDYIHNNYKGTKSKIGIGITLTSIGAVTMLSGALAIALNSDESEIGGGIALAGAGLLGIGMGIGMPADKQLDQTNHQYEYKYLHEQRTNHDIPISNPQFDMASYKPAAIVTATVSSEIESSTMSNRKISQQSTKTLKDFGAQLEGEYIGNGKLTKGSETIEAYHTIKVVLKRVSQNIVSVNVIESNGNKYFPIDSNYKIEKEDDGSYVLTLEGISSATIQIDGSGNLNYSHPRVNIDGDIYSLSINNGKKE